MKEYTVIITPKARKEIDSTPEAERVKILTAIKGLKSFPFVPNLKKLKASRQGEWRQRVGDWRALFTVVDDEVHVHRVRARKEAYRE